MTSGRRRYNPVGYTEFKDELGYFALKAMAGREPLTGAIKLSAEFYKNRKGITTGQWGDVDNFLKAIMDSLTGICYEDDGQIIQVSAVKKSASLTSRLNWRKSNGIYKMERQEYKPLDSEDPQRG